MPHSQALYQQALERLRQLIDEAAKRGIEEAHAAALATADRQGRPSVRTIYVIAVEDDGLLFFANQRSGKGRQLLANPRAALCFFWPQLQQQVTLEGSAELLPEAVAEQYWRRRSREAQLAAWVSDQQPSGASAPSPREQRRQLEQAAGFEPLARHADWCAFRLHPERIEFWPTGWRRMHERLRYQRDAEGHWSTQAVNP